jgi:hypothetical protein
MIKYLLGYFTAHSMPDYKNVIVSCLFEENTIYDLYRNEIVNLLKAQYTTNNIFKILTIQDNKMKNYENAINIFENDNTVFNINDTKIISKNMITFYIDKSVATFLNLNYKVRKSQKYDENGNLILDGVYIDGIFNGFKIENGIKLEYKEGIVI